MNAPVSSFAVSVRVADLAAVGERAAIAAYIAAHPDATPFHRIEWGEATEAGCGQKFVLYVARDADGAVAGVLPVSEVRSALFGAALVSAGFAVGGGVLADTPAVADALLSALVERARDGGFPTIELRGGAAPAGPGWRVDRDRYLGFVRPIAGDDDAELLAIPRKQRAEVRKALAGDMEIAVGRDRAARAEHFRVYGTSVRNLGTPVFPPRLFAEVLDRFGDDADILTVRSGGQAVASVLSLYFRGTVYPYWGGGTHAARGLRANDLMYFALMRHARARGCTRFDFGRSKVGTGPAAFKRNWGFVGEPLSYPTWVAPGAAERDASPLNPKYRLKIALWQRLPVAVANRVGPLLARGLG